MWLVVFLVVFVLTYYANFRRSRKRLYELANRIPGPFDYPVIGSALMGIGRGPSEIVAYLLQFLHLVPSPMRFWAGPYLFLVIDRPDLLQIALNSPDCLDKPFVYDFFHLEKGLFGAPPPVWKLHRKPLNLTFSPAILRTFVPVFNEKSRRLLKRFDDLVGQGSFDAYEVLCRYTLTSLCATVLGVDVEPLGDKFLDDYSHNSDEMFTLMYTRIYKFWLHSDFIYRLTPTYREVERRLEQFRLMSKQILKQRREMRAQQSVTSTHDGVEETGQSRSKIFIDMLEDLPNTVDPNIDEQSLLQHLDTMIFAGSDTTATAVASVLLILAMYPSTQEAVYQEIQAVAPDGDLGMDDLGKLTYLEMVIKETLRVVPISGVIARVTGKEMQMNEITVPAGAILMMPILKIHRDKKLWGPDSEVFNPNNFLPENCAQRHPYAYMPFSHGQRNCIGVKFSWLSIKVVLCHLVRQFRFNTDLTLDKLQFKISIILKLANKHMITVERR